MVSKQGGSDFGDYALRAFPIHLGDSVSSSHWQGD